MTFKDLSNLEAHFNFCTCGSRYLLCSCFYAEIVSYFRPVSIFLFEAKGYQAAGSIVIKMIKDLDLYNCGPCKYCKCCSPLPTNAVLDPHAPPSFHAPCDKKEDIYICHCLNKQQSGQPMAQRYSGPQGMSDRGCDSSRIEADALLTPSWTQERC